MEDSSLDTIDYKSLLSSLTSVKKHFQTRMEDGVPAPIVANLGVEAGQFITRTRGEYEGLMLQVLGPIKPLITSNTMERAITAMSKQQYMVALDILSLASISELLYTINKWYLLAAGVRTGIVVETNHEELDEWISTERHMPIRTSVKVVRIAPGMPEDWSEREFESGDELQAEWSIVRRGPPVTYAVTHSMRLVTEKTVLTADEIRDEAVGAVIYLIDGTDYISTEEIEDGYEYVVYTDETGTVVIGFKNVFSDELVEEIKTHSVSYLVSLLQKCIRYGPGAASVLVDVVDALHHSPDYHIPERGFERVSAARQLVWRSYISIVEDVGPIPYCDYLLLLVLVTSKRRGHFRDDVVDKIAVLLLQSLTVDAAYDWRHAREAVTAKKSANKMKNIESGPEHVSYSLALRFLPMMEGDTAMLTLYNLRRQDSMIVGDIPDIDVGDLNDVRVRAIDHHCKPSIILLLQSTLDVSAGGSSATSGGSSATSGGRGTTLQEVSRFIWDTSSAYNYRYSKKKPGSNTDLYQLQAWVLEGDGKRNKSSSSTYIQLPSTVTPSASRRAFLCLFGETFVPTNKKMGKRACYAGTEEEPLKALSGTGNDMEWKNVEAVDFDEWEVSTKDMPLDLGLQWTKSSYRLSIEAGVPMVDGSPIPWFDASDLLISSLVEYTTSDETLEKTIVDVLGGHYVPWSTYERLISTTSHAVEWKDLVTAPQSLLLGLLVKLQDEDVSIGPVDRSGRATKQAVDSVYEGRMWGCMVLFSHMYSTVKMKSSHIVFSVRRGIERDHIISSLRFVLDKHYPSLPASLNTNIQTELWVHQRQSVDRILSAYEAGSYGVGDASHVGAGKTLVGLTVASERGSTLILLPSPTLIPTWTDEISKHTSGFRVAIQQANGTLQPIGEVSDDYDIVISTMGRMRDHPQLKRWKLLIIDECLTVQNAKAQWTASAWRQSIMSDNILMLSATFFRSRYDKLYYMLKMLRSNLPERKEYLDAILIETMISQQPSDKREWITEMTPMTTPPSILRKQSELLRQKTTTEAKYSAIASLLSTVSVVEHLRSITEGRKCLVYARSTTEAEGWSEALDIPLYPDISGDSVIVSLARGTYGLNNLIKYDCLVTRPPEPDRLPQMKGRLDRPGQQATSLTLIYFWLKDTIEEGLVKRLEVADQFSTNYKMPLSDFYALSLNM